MPTLNIRLFGQFSVCRDDASLEELIPGKAKELICYLLIHRQRPLVREFLANILWDDCTTEHSMQYLRKALWQLHRTFCKCAATAEPILQVNSHWVSINPRADIWVDVVEFERFCAGALNPSLPPEASRLDLLEAAVNIYRGDLLEGWYQDWCLCDRGRLQNLHLMVLDKLVAHAGANHEYEKGIDYATRILRCDRAHETAHQHLMQLLYLSGDRAGALRQYDNCVTALKEELGVQPSEHIRLLYQQICEDHAPSLTAGTNGDHREPEKERSLLQGTLNGLVNVKKTLNVLQAAVDESLERVRRAFQASNHTADPKH